MGFFHMISGNFTPGSYDRKDAGVYLKDLLLRLGILLLIYTLFIDPFIPYSYCGCPEQGLFPLMSKKIYKKDVIPVCSGGLPPKSESRKSERP
jgi:hypothetical protein